MPKIFLIVFIVILLFTGTDCKDKPPVMPPDNKPPDTTSHNFAFTTYTFGGNAGSSYFKDVAIVNDSDIWAVGAIYASPETTYNAAHWDGKEWGLKRITYNFQGQSFFSPLQAVFTFSVNDVWIGSTQPQHWNGSEWEQFDITPTIFNGYVYKFWGTSSQNLYIVGTNGSIAHYNGSSWSKQESGTTIDLRDVWGTPDGKTVWACGYSNDNDKSILLEYNGTNWKTIWMRQGITANPPFGYFVTSLWSDKSLYLSAGRAVFHIAAAETTQVATLPWFPNCLKGSTENNIGVVGDEGIIWHYNGSSWKELGAHSGQMLTSVALSKNLFVAVGADFTSLLGGGIIYVGKK